MVAFESRKAEAAKAEPSMFKIPFYRHDLGEPEIAAIREVLSQDILTTGTYVSAFEERFSAWTGQRHTLGVTSATGALHLSLVALGIGAGDEVITTPMSFIATATAIMEAGARPVFVDIEPDTGNIDADRIEAAITSRTKAIMPVHLYGQMCDMKALRHIADRHGLFIVEDCAHCVEGMRDGVRPGDLSDTACFSFYATKNLTCGEGGAITVNDDALYERLKLLRLHGMTKTAADRAREGYTDWDMVLMGWKYNMSNIEAALLLPQFDRIDAKLARRHRLAERYDALLAPVPGLRRPQLRSGIRHARHLYPVLVDTKPRGEVIEKLQRRGIGAVVNYRPIHLTSYFRETFGYASGAFPIAEDFGGKVLSLPFWPDMPVDMIDTVAAAITEFLAP